MKLAVLAIISVTLQLMSWSQEPTPSVEFIPQKAIYLLGEPVFLTERFKNDGDREASLEQGMNNEMLWFAEEGGEYKQSRYWEQGGFSYTALSRVLKPHSKWLDVITLNEWLDLTPGVHKIKWRFDKTNLQSGLTIEIRTPAENELKVELARQLAAEDRYGKTRGLAVACRLFPGTHDIITQLVKETTNEILHRNGAWALFQAKMTNAID